MNEIDKPSQQINMVEVSENNSDITLHVYLNNLFPSFPRAYLMRDIRNYYKTKIQDYVGVKLSGVYFVIMRRE